MIRMTLVSFVTHIVAMVGLVALSLYHPATERPKPMTQIRIPINMFKLPQPSPAAAGAKSASPKPQVKVEKERTPAPTSKPVEKTIARKKPTPKATKTAKASPTPGKTTSKKTPEKTAKRTPEATKAPEPVKTTAEPEKTPDPRPTLPPWVPNPPKSLEPTPSWMPTLDVTPRPGQPIAWTTGPLTDYEYYYAMAQLKISANFNVPQNLRNPDLLCWVSFRILRDGKIQNIEVVRSTGDRMLDQYAVRALELTDRLPPIPDPIKEPFIDLTVGFSFAMDEVAPIGKRLTRTSTD